VEALMAALDLLSLSLAHTPPLSLSFALSQVGALLDTSTYNALMLAYVLLLYYSRA